MTNIRQDRNNDFREIVFTRFNHQCCFKPEMVPTWCEFKKLSEEQKKMQCKNNSEDTKLMLYKKDGDINNNKDDNILVLCKYHYGVMFNELRTKIKNMDNKSRGIKKEHKKLVLISEEDYRKLLSYVSNPDHLMLLQTFYYLGGRANEVVLLTKEDVIDLNKMDPMIRFRAETTKRKVERYVQIPPNMIEPYKNYVKGKQDSERLFNFTPQRAWQIVKLYVEKAKLDKSIHPHTFRHAYATKIYESLGDLKIVQELLGHKNIATTSIYAHTSNAMKRAAINKVFGKK